MSRLSYIVSLCVLLLLAACAGELNAPGEALRLLGGNLDEAVVGEPYEEALRTAGGLRPYSYELLSGTLPEGVELKGGVLRGTPVETGDFSLTVSVSDANLSSTFHEYRFRVIEVPPPALELTIPLTETRSAFTVRAGVKDARRLRGVSTRISWDPELFALAGDSVEGTDGNIVFFSEAAEGWLQVDLAFTGTVFSGGRDLFRFRLEPLGTARPGVEAASLFVSEGAASESFSRASAGSRVARRPAQRPITETDSGEPAVPADDGTPDGELPDGEAGQ